MKIVLIVICFLLAGCSAKFVSHGKARYFSINLLTFSDVKDIDAQFEGGRLRVGSTHIHPDPNSIKATGELVGEAGKILITP